jgi:hypothetical protein
MEISEWKEGWQLWDLIAHLTKVGAFASNNLFRGQTNADWDLVPGLYRRKVNIFNELARKSDLYIIAENKMLAAFFDRGAMLLPNYPRSAIMDRIIAQHYGVPTQLLDWTLDPFIALYFAVHGGNSTNDCSLFYINPLRRLINREHYGELPWTGKIAVLFPPIIDDRIRAQKSVFTLHHYGELENFTPLDQRRLKFSQGGEGSNPYDEVESIGKIVIPAKHREQILFQLIGLGVDSSLVYPGLQGIGQRIFDIASIQNYGGGGGY